jgi:hypothetical protein
MKRTRINITLAPDHLRMLEDICIRLDAPKTAVIRRAIEVLHGATFGTFVTTTSGTESAVIAD